MNTQKKTSSKSQAQAPAQVPEHEISYQDPSIEAPAGTPGDVVRLDTLAGFVPQVTADPTWTPKRFKDSFAFGNISGTRYLYAYDAVANAWYKVALTAV